MKHRILLCLCVLTFGFSSFAQSPVYLTKAYKPVESEYYDAYSSHEIQGGDTWNNCFVLGVINNYCGRAVFNLGGKYETISFIMGPDKGHGKYEIGRAHV